MKLKREAWIEIFVFIAIMLLATFLRVYRLAQLPPGLHYDEAFKGVEARRVIAGTERPIFFQENLTEEPMRIYSTVLTFVLFGDSTWSLRLSSALAGILNVAALYLLARALFRSWRTAALAAFVLAILYWHINFSRLGMEPILTPLMLTLSFGFLWRALERGEGREARGKANQPSRAMRHSPLDFALAGLFLAATQYTYKAALFVPPLVVAFLGIEILIDRTFWARHRRGLAIFAVVAVLFFAPLGLYFVAHPDQFIERPSTVTVASSGIGTLVDNVLKVAGMFFVRGDDNPRSNLPFRPALDPFLAVGFVAGLVAAVATIRKRESRFLLLWLVVMALPSVLTDFAPHFGRDIGLPPVVALLVAAGFALVVEQARRAHWSLVTVYCLLFAGLAFSAYSSVNDYLNVWGARTGLFDSFDVGYLQLAQALRAQPANESVYLSPVDQGYYTIQYGLDGRAARSFDGRSVLVLPPPGKPAAYGIVTREDARSLPLLKRLYPDGRVVDTIYDYVAKPYASVFRVDDSPRTAPQNIVQARLGNVIGLIGYDMTRDAGAITLTVYWSSLAATNSDYTVFVHLLGAPNPATASPVWAQDDTRPGRGSYPTTRWQPGEIVIDQYHLTIPPAIPRGDYQIEIGMYTLETGARVRMTDANGAPMENNRVLLERIPLP
jgi:4-amino-4-deoxy-L-arabinose transferase-like glycosyltransferase